MRKEVKQKNNMNLKKVTTTKRPQNRRFFARVALRRKKTLAYIKIDDVVSEINVELKDISESGVAFHIPKEHNDVIAKCIDILQEGKFITLLLFDEYKIFGVLKDINIISLVEIVRIEESNNDEDMCSVACKFIFQEQKMKEIEDYVTDLKTNWFVENNDKFMVNHHKNIGYK